MFSINLLNNWKNYQLQKELTAASPFESFTLVTIYISFCFHVSQMQFLCQTSHQIIIIISF